MLSSCYCNRSYTFTIRRKKVGVLKLQSGKNLTVKSNEQNVFLQGVSFVRHHFVKCSFLRIASRDAFVVGRIYLILLFFYIAMWTMNVSYGFPQCNYFLVLPVLWRETNDKTWNKDSLKNNINVVFNLFLLCF